MMIDYLTRIKFNLETNKHTHTHTKLLFTKQIHVVTVQNLSFALYVFACCPA